MPQFQSIIVGIFCAAVFLLLPLGLLYWVFFTPSGKAFAQNYNRLQQEKAKAESSYTRLMLDFRNLSTFQQVDEWDRVAHTEIEKLIDSIQAVQAEIDRPVTILDRLKIIMFKKQYITVIESLAGKLQEAIDFTPNSPKEQKILIKELRHQKKELQLQKRELTANMRTVQVRARQRSTYAGRGFLGIYNSKVAAQDRRAIRYQKESALRPSEDIKAALERQILQIDKDILWAERFSD